MEPNLSDVSSSWFEDLLCCPEDHAALRLHDGRLVCARGHSYPVVDGVPVMLLDRPYTLWVAAASLVSARKPTPQAGSIEAYRSDTLGISPEQRAELEQLLVERKRGKGGVDPVVAMLVGATNGILYQRLIGKLPSYPIPDLRLPRAQGERLIDVGCGWGRWSIAAARKGYSVIGVDPSLGALLAAKRMARELGVQAHFVCADARYLPFRAGTFRTAFSYSVLQHFSKADTRAALAAMRAVLAPGGTALVQMPNEIGIRCLYHQARRRFREAVDFEVRYWSVRELKRCFEQVFGQAEIETDCFFGLGLQANDRALFRTPVRYLISTSELLRAVSKRIKPLTLLADSLYVRARVAA